MKRLICLMVSLLICFSMVMPAVAAEGEFVPSITYKDGPELISATINGKDCIVITSIKQAKDKTTDITQDERDLLLDVYAKLEDGSMKLPLDYDYVIRELVDINFKFDACREQDSHNEIHDEWLEKEGNTITIVLKLGISKKDSLEVLQYKNNAWKPIEKVTNNGDGTVTLVFEHFCPVAFVLKESNSPNAPGVPNNPKTGDVMGQNLGLWIALMAGAAVALVAVVTISRKKK